MEKLQSRYPNILEALFNNATLYPNKTAFSFLEGKDIDRLSIKSLTYSELYLKANQLSLLLRGRTNLGDRVLLCYPTGLDFIVAFYAALLAQVVAVPVAVPNNLGMIKKFITIANDSESSLLLTDVKTYNAYLQGNLFSKHDTDLETHDCFREFLEKTDYITTDNFVLNYDINTLNHGLPTINTNDVAFLQYTSGSTSTPKGVMVTHQNLLHNISEISKGYKVNNHSICLTWLPHTHDMGLVGNLLQCSYIGMTLHIFSPLTFIRNPIFWLQCIDKFFITTTSVPNFALSLCLEKITPEILASLDLSSLTCLTVGAEIISADILNKFSKVFAQAGFREDAFAPSYGLAECTLMVSSGFGMKSLNLNSISLYKNEVKLAENKINSKNVVSCGNPFQKIKIVHPETLIICDENEIGEILIKGLSVTKGYWNKPDTNKKIYHCELADGDTYFRSGDLGYLYDGELYITGRIKDVIIINGFNYYSHDIENCVTYCDPLIKNSSVVAFSYRTDQVSSTDSFVVLIKKPRGANDIDLEPLLTKIKFSIIREFQLIPHDIQFVDFNFPKTTSGKTQKNLCRIMYEDLVCQNIR